MRTRSLGYTVLATALVSLALAASSALAADEAPNSRVHGFLDGSFKNDYITPRGLLVNDTAETVQIVGGLVFNLYKQPGAALSDVSAVIGTFNDISTGQNNPKVGAWTEFDWFGGLNFVFVDTWKFQVAVEQFLSPPGNFKAETNIEFTVAYDDSKWGLPVTFNPYVRPFYAVSGDSTVVVGKRGDTFDVEIGLVPTLDLNKYRIPLTLSAPTWVTVGPEEYWNGGKGVLKCTTCSSDNAGVFSTGLQGKVPLKFIPTSFGNWYVRAGAQYYHIINDNLLYAQTFTRGLPLTVGAPSAAARRDVGVLFFALGFGF
jgi:hypothetical protein